MALTLRQKVELYEDTLKRIAGKDTELECTEALNHPSNTFVENKYPFAFGMIGAAYKDVVSDARWALNQGRK